MGGGGVLCQMLISRNAHASCYCCCSCTSLKTAYIVCCTEEIMLFIFIFLLLGPMSHLDFTKWQCRRVKLKGQEPR